MLLILNVVYVLVAVAMIALILMQRGAGAQAGSGFGAGASATVFGSRGASNFMTKSTKWLAIIFFAVAMFMAWNATHGAKKPAAASEQDLGVMSQTVVPKADANAPAVPVQPMPQAAPTQPLPEAPANANPQPVAEPPAAAPVQPEPQGG